VSFLTEGLEDYLDDEASHLARCPQCDWPLTLQALKENVVVWCKNCDWREPWRRIVNDPEHDR